MRASFIPCLMIALAALLGSVAEAAPPAAAAPAVGASAPIAGDTGAGRAPAAAAERARPAWAKVVGTDWSEYKDTEALRAARLFWWFRKDADANDHVDLVPDETFGRAVRIRFEPNTGGLGSAPRLLTKLPEPLEKVWFRWRVRFSPGWTTVGPEPAGSANAYKLAFWHWEGGLWGRGQIAFSNTDQYILECYWGKTSKEAVHPDSKPTPGSQNFGRVTTEWTDGQWYEFVVYYETIDAKTCRQHWWRRRLTEKGRIVGGPFIYRGVELSGAEPPRVRAVELGANKNKNTPKEQFLYWGPWEAVDGSKHGDPFGLLVPRPEPGLSDQNLHAPRPAPDADQSGGR